MRVALSIIGEGLSLSKIGFRAQDVHVTKPLDSSANKKLRRTLRWSYPVIEALTTCMVSASIRTKPGTSLFLRFGSRETHPALFTSYSSIVLTQSHPPLSLSFHRLTRLSPVLTASTLPLRLQLTRHAAASTLRTVDFQSSNNN